MDQKQIDSCIWEGRARVMWGDNEIEVLEWLSEKGVPDEVADKHMKVWRAERDAEIRKRGLSQCLSGGLVFGLGLLGCIALYTMGRISLYAVAATCFGLYRLGNGLFLLMNGRKVRGSIGQITNDD